MLARGLPLSLLVHLLGLVLIVMFGNEVARQPLQPPHAIRVKLVQMPRSRPAEQQPEPVAEPAVREEKPADLPPKELPEPRQETKPREQEPDPTPIRRQEQEAEKPVENTETRPADTPTVSSPSVTATDTDFPFSWYLSLVEGKIISNWRPRQLGFGRRAVVSCAVHFNIARNGSVTSVTLVRNSGVGVYDREALRAVQTSRLPPLPPDYRASNLGVTFVFNLEP